MTKEQRERLASIRDNLSAARDRRRTANTALTAAQQSGDADLIRTAEAAADTAHAEVEQLSQLEVLVLGQVAGAGESFGTPLRDNLDALGTMREIATSTAQILNNVSLGPVMSMAATLGLFGRSLEATTSVPSLSPARGSQFDGIVRPAQAPRSILDLFVARPVDVRTIDFVARTGSVPSGGPVAEAAMKPEASFTYTPGEAHPETFPTWTKVPRQQLEDVDELLADIRLALGEGILRNLERALLNGSAPFAMEGIKTVSGTISTDLSGVNNLADAAALVLSDLTTIGVDANFLAVSPTTYTQEVIRKASGSGEYLNQIDDQGRLHRVPLVQSIALAPGEIVAGDSRVAGYVGVRQPPTAFVGTEQDDMTRNLVTILVELRATPVIKAPDHLAVAKIGE